MPTSDTLASARPAHSTDDRRPRRSSAGSGVARVAVFAALMAVLGLVPPVPVAGIPAPIVLQNLAVTLAGVILGPWRGAAAILLFNVLVALGLPLLTGGRGGLGVFVGPSSGFILGYVVAAAAVGLVFWALTGRARPGLRPGRVLAAALVAGLVGMVVLYAAGAVGFIVAAHMEPGAAVLAMGAFVPGDTVKVVLAALLVTGLWKAYPRAFR